jgi:methyl-accepting chemotaxis protein
VAQIAAASHEQSVGIEQVNRAVGQMDQVVQANAAQTEELSSTAQALAAQAAELQRLVARFKLNQALQVPGVMTLAPSPAPAPDPRLGREPWSRHPVLVDAEDAPGYQRSSV